MHAQIRLRHLSLALLVLCGAAAGAVTPAACGEFIGFPIPTPYSNPESITAGPDGALWLFDCAANKTGRTTTAGVITEFPIPTANSQPRAITAGPDGALWFTELG